MSEERAPTTGLHPHYCNICEADWEHDKACQEGPVTCCPWCFPTAGAAPVPGARLGPHFHFCPECTQNWQHQVACSAPLRAALPDCTGCHEQGGRERSPIDVAPAPSHDSRPDRVRRARLLRKVVLPGAIAAGVIIAIPLLVLVSSLITGRQTRSVARLPEPAPVAIPPTVVVPPTVELPAPSLPTPTSEEPTTRAPDAPSSVTAQAHAQREGERRHAWSAPPPPLKAAAPTTPPGPTVRKEPTARAPEAPSSVTAQARAQREGERRQAWPAPPAAPQVARIVPPSESTVAPKPAAPATPPVAALREEPRVAPAPPPPAQSPAPPREAIAETVPRAPEAPTPPSETRTATVPGPTVGSIPGALSQGSGAALDTLLPGPRQVAKAAATQPELSSESPRWARAAISVLMRAVVDVRPPQRRELLPSPSRGFVVDELGHVLTSAHRLGDATSLEVTLSDGRTVVATVIARDRLNDIAVLRLARRGVPAIPLGESAALAVGERVLAISGESGADRTPTAATVLATGAGTGGNLAIDLVPTPEGVGGPLLNQTGAAIGILIDGAVSAGAQRKLTFAVPIDRVKALLRNARPRPMADLLSAPEGR
jgi:putative serine protease PepD